MTPRGWALVALIGIAAGSAIAQPAPEVPARRELGPQRGDLFPAPPAPRPAPPPQKEPEPPVAAPAPPPNPYRFAGTVQHDGKRRVFLAIDNRIVEAREGEKLEQGFRVQSVTDQAVTLVYEPLDIPVTMALVFTDPPAPSVATGATRSPLGPPAFDGGAHRAR